MDWKKWYALDRRTKVGWLGAFINLYYGKAPDQTLMGWYELEQDEEDCYCHILDRDDRPCGHCWRRMYPEWLEDER
jgi:hypothetical protein